MSQDLQPNRAVVQARNRARLRDRALVDACIGGAQDAWQELVTAHHDTVRFAIIRTLQMYRCNAPDHLVEDLESALFLKLVVNDFRRLKQYKAQATLKSWLKVLATNATRDHLRKRKRTEPVDGPDAKPIADTGPSPLAQLERAQLHERLRRLWERLPSGDAEFVELYYVRELGFDEIAERMQTTTAALYTRKNRVRKRLRRLAADDGWFEAI